MDTKLQAFNFYEDNPATNIRLATIRVGMNYMKAQKNRSILVNIVGILSHQLLCLLVNLVINILLVIIKGVIHLHYEIGDGNPKSHRYRNVLMNTLENII